MEEVGEGGGVELRWWICQLGGLVGWMCGVGNRVKRSQ